MARRGLTTQAHVAIEPSGRKLVVEPGETVLEAAVRHGLNLPHSCRGGHCGTCAAHLVEGDVSYPDGRPPGLSPDDAARGRALLCRAVPATPAVSLEVREVLPADAPGVRRFPCRVSDCQQLCHDVMALRLRMPAVMPLRFLPGQYVDVLWRGSRRSFSIASPPGSAHEIELHVRRVPGGGFTNAVFETLAAGSLLELEGPLGSFFWRPSGRPVLMMGGGTGLAPLASMLSHALEEGLKQSVTLYWGVRGRRDLYAHGWLRDEARRQARFDYVPVLSDPATDAADPGDWTGRCGWVHEALLDDWPDLTAHDVYMSGPPQMIEAARCAFNGAGLPAERLHFDSFDYAPDVLRRMRAAGGSV